MGWSETVAHHFTKGGNVDRKAECDSLFSEKYKVVKSRMVGSVYYAAVECSGEVFGYVMHTSLRTENWWYIFRYKGIHENAGPGECDCPKSILDLLTPTDSDYANEWRRKCYARLERTRLSDLPVGTEIEYSIGDTRYHLRKMAPSFQFKRPFWMVMGQKLYVPKNQITENFIVKEN